MNGAWSRWPVFALCGVLVAFAGAEGEVAGVFFEGGGAGFDGGVQDRVHCGKAGVSVVFLVCGVV